MTVKTQTVSDHLLVGTVGYVVVLVILIHVEKA